MPKPIASLSLDLDNKWSYLKTHGESGWEKFPSYLGVVVPRFLELFDELGLRATVFVVGQDAARDENREPLAQIAAAGHEIGNHSFHHEPWLHLYSSAEIEDEIAAAEEAILAATGVAPIGFRGPGYSLSPAVLSCLIRRGYRYDASTFPTLIGPLARAYYFFSARLSAEERRRRKRLFGGWTDGLQRLTPYWWQMDGEEGARSPQRRILEIPVTTLPVLRAPIHFSYLLFLCQHSPALAWGYWRLAMRSCRIAGVAPSLLLHPLDLLGGDEERDLSFFPGMRLGTAQKRRLIRNFLADFAQRFEVLTLRAHAARVVTNEQLPVRAMQPITESQLITSIHQPKAEPALSLEASRR